jgi:Flp pilus assembly secretin CpaC
MQIMVGDLEIIKVQNLQRLSITNPDVADITDAKNDEIQIMGKSAGDTILFLWDDFGKRTTMIRVIPEELEHVKTRILKILERTDIQGLTMKENEVEGVLVITGTLPTEHKEKFDSLVATFEGKVMNLVAEEKLEDMIQIDMQVTELSTTLLKTMGFKWTNSLGYSETLPASDGDFEDLFRIGDFSRTSAILATQRPNPGRQGKGPFETEDRR